MSYAQLLDDLRAFRAAWIGGRMRGGKTSLAYAIAIDLSSRYGYQITGNVPSVFRRTAEVLRHTVVVLDEVGVMDVTPTKLQMALGKLDIITLYPSAQRPHKDMCKMTVRLVARPNEVLPWLLPYELWQVEFPDLGRKATYYAFASGRKAWGCYDSGAMPIDDGGFAKQLERSVKRIATGWQV